MTGSLLIYRSWLMNFKLNSLLWFSSTGINQPVAFNRFQWLFLLMKCFNLPFIFLGQTTHPQSSSPASLSVGDFLTDMNQNDLLHLPHDLWQILLSCAVGLCSFDFWFWNNNLNTFPKILSTKYKILLLFPFEYFYIFSSSILFYFFALFN